MDLALRATLNLGELRGKLDACLLIQRQPVSGHSHSQGIGPRRLTDTVAAHLREPSLPGEIWFSHTQERMA